MLQIFLGLVIFYMAGIYMIIDDRTGSFYIGSTVTSFAARFASHRSALKGGYGPPLVQAAWNKTGDPGYWFRFVPLHECPVKEVRLKEEEAIRTLKPLLNTVTPEAVLNAAARAVGTTVEAMRYRQSRGQPLDRPKGLRDTIDGVSLTLKQIAAKTGLPERLVRERYSRGDRGGALIRPAGLRR